jgi:Tripartite tricarboxylate transporter family receptor
MVGVRRLTCTFMLAALLTTLFAAAPVAAQSWPTRPVKFILTLGPGSGADIGARLLADRLTKKWDQPIVIENRPGGDGILAINAFVSAQDDHILLFAPSSSFIGHPYQHDNLPYKPDDLAPIARVSNTVIGISVPMDLPVKTLASTKPGQLNWAGLTGALDIMFEGWLKSIGVDIKKCLTAIRSRRLTISLPAAYRSTSQPMPSPARRSRLARSRSWR